MDSTRYELFSVADRLTPFSLEPNLKTHEDYPS